MGSGKAEQGGLKVERPYYGQATWYPIQEWRRDPNNHQMMVRVRGRWYYGTQVILAGPIKVGTMVRFVGW